MKTNQLNKGNLTRLMYFENKRGLIDGVTARIGWAQFSKTGKSIKYRGLEFQSCKGRGNYANYFETISGDEYWISGVKKRGSNIHYAEKNVQCLVDEDAKEALKALREIAVNT